MNEDLKTILESSYKKQSDFQQDVGKLGYSYDPELSTMENKVFFDPKTNKPSIAYRGSTTINKDWVGNLQTLFGFKDPEAEKRIQLADKVKEKYGDIDTIYGHSRGGLIAEKAGERTGSKVITYNKAVDPKDIFKSIRPIQTDIRTTGDVVSLPSFFQKGGKKELIKTTKSPYGLFYDVIKAHSITNL